MEKKSHTLFLCSWYPNRTDPTSGNFVQKHAEAAALYGAISSLSIFSDHIKEKRNIDCEEQNGVFNVTVYYKKVTSNIPLISNIQKVFRYIGAFNAGYKIVTQKYSKPDIVHLNIIYPIGIFAVFLKYAKKIPYVATENWTAFLPNGISISWITKFISKVIFNNAAVALPVSEDLKNSLTKMGIKNNFEIISNVVDVNKFKVKTVSQKPKKQLLHISTAKDDHKNISGILRVIKQLSDSRNDFHLLIVSDGNIKPHIEYAEKLGILNQFVFFDSTKTTEEISLIMQESDSLVLFSNYENFPCVIAEALVTGLPVVSSNVNGIPEHVNNNSGILVNPRDEKALFHALNKMLDTCFEYDPQQLRAYGITHFSYEEVGKRFHEVYQSVLK